MIGKRLAHYEVLAPLGKGGMGEVYRARDTRLGREVALKILPEELSRDEGRRARFEREAQTVAALNHPNVVTLYAVEEADGVHFLAMELVEGQTLAEAIPPGGLSVDRFLALARPLCEAVAAAHAKGITHRDLKPQNVMIDREGRIKVLDFGLAKILESAWQVDDGTLQVTAHATREGAIVGTAAYMSPEQAEGKPVDARSDVFSLGVLLYEMLTGQRAFQGDTHLSTLTAVLRDNPRSVLEIRPEIPRQIARILRRCLEKDPDRRYESAKGLRYDLEILQEELGSGEYPSAAPAAPVTGPAREGVTPDSAPSRSHDSDGAGAAAYGSAAGTLPPSGVPASLSTASGERPPVVNGSRARVGWIAGIALVAVVALFVLWSQRNGNRGENAATPTPGAAPTAEPTIVVFPFQNLGPAEDAYFAAGVTDEIVTSLVQVEGLRVLSRTSAQQYDRAGKTMQQVADELGVDYVLEGTVRWQRSEGESSRVRVTPQLVDAHADQQVWGERYDRTMEEIFAVQTEIAEEVVRQLGGALAVTVEAAEVESPTENMEAYHAYLRAKSIVDGTRFLPDEWYLAEQLFERALKMDPDFHEAWAELGKLEAGICHFGWDRTDERLARSRTAVDRAARLKPDDPLTYLAQGYYHYWGLKDYAPALEAFHKAEALRPNDTDVGLAIAYVQRRQGDFRAALDNLVRVAELSPQDGSLRAHIAETYGVIGEYEAADRWARRGLLLEPDSPFQYSTALWIAATAGDAQRVQELLAVLPVQHEAGIWVRCVQSSYQVGDYANALSYCEKLPDFQEDQYFAICRPFEEAQIQQAMGREAQALDAYRRAEEILARARESSPESGTAAAALARCLAALGRTDEALELVRRSLTMYPADKDVWIHSWRVYDLAIVQILGGRHEEAVETLRELTSEPTDAVSPALLRRSPAFDPLRGREDFEALVRSQS